ncbi:MAG: hypothetical protein H8D67_10800 [Deltaproteobacteria bacterium]|nr:hypothetical protein [Deltaproteobacteria bacterium]
MQFKQKLAYIALSCVLLFFGFALLINVRAQAQDKRIDNKVYKDYSLIEPKVNDANIFRSEVNKYRIKLPRDWKINRGNSIGVEFNAISLFGLGGASMNMVIATLDENAGISAHDIPVDGMINLLKNRYPGVKLIESKKMFLSNEKCLLIKYSFGYKTLDYNVKLITSQYNVMRGNKAFTLTFQVAEELQKEHESVIEETLLSFVFEDFEDQLYEENKTEKTTGRALGVRVLLSIFINWVIGLFPAVFLRYVIFRRPIKKRLSYVISGIIGFLLFLLVSLVAFLAETRPNVFPVFLWTALTYWIIHRGYVDETNENG